MTAASLDPKTPGNEPTSSAAAPGLDETLHRAWKDNSRFVIGACVLVLVAILGWGGWKVLAGNKEKEIQQTFELATTPEKQRAFVNQHSAHPLAAIAYLQLADEAYATSQYAAAVADYDKAVAALPEGPFKSRATMGAAMARVGAGQTAEGEAGLRKIADDTTALKSLRAEALYHLASIALAAGRNADVARFTETLMTVDMDPQGPWLSRAFELRSRATAGAGPAAAPSGPASMIGPSGISAPAPAAGPSIVVPK